MKTEQFLERLDGVQRASGSFQARCPAHDDRAPSLNIKEAEDKILLKCHAGCDTEDILAAMDLRWRDLWHDSGPATRDARRDYWEQPEAEYVYRDEDGDELYRVVRFPGKRFIQSRVRVPYRLPQLIEAVDRGEQVFVVEGEKDVHALVEAGAAATCNAGGVDEWQSEWSRYFEGANVVIVQDKDEPGREHARAIAGMLYPQAQRIVIVEAVVGKDAADHLSDPWMTPATFRIVREIK